MKLTEIVNALGLTVKNAAGLDKEARRGYASDLLSDVLANAGEGDVWVTMQIHPNIVGVASIKGLSGILIIGGRQPEEATLKKAKEENIAVMVSEMPAFEVVGKLYALGIPGTRTDVEGN